MLHGTVVTSLCGNSCGSVYVSLYDKVLKMLNCFQSVRTKSSALFTNRVYNPTPSSLMWHTIYWYSQGMLACRFTLLVQQGWATLFSPLSYHFGWTLLSGITSGGWVMYFFRCRITGFVDCTLPSINAKQQITLIDTGSAAGAFNYINNNVLELAHPC